MQPIIKVNVSITDRGETYPIKPFEVQGNIQSEVKKYLTKYRHAFDLSKNYSFQINDSQITGYGTI